MPRRRPGTSSEPYVLEFTVWWTIAPLIDATLPGSHVRRVSSAPHAARLTTGGWAAAAEAVAAGARATDASAALVPPSTNVAVRRSSPAPTRELRTRTWISSDPVTPTGSVATFDRRASAVPGSGAESDRPIAAQRPHDPSCRLRTSTVTPFADARSGKPTPTTSAPSVSRVSTVSLTDAGAAAAEAASGVAEAAGVAVAPAAPAGEAAATARPGANATRSTLGATACGDAPTVTTGTTSAVPASRVDAVTMRRIL